MRLCRICFNRDGDGLYCGSGVHGVSETILLLNRCVLQHFYHCDAPLLTLSFILLRSLYFSVAFAFGYYGTLLATTRVFASTDEENTSKGDDAATESFDFFAIFVSSMAEFAGTTIVILVVDRVGRISTQVVAYALAGISLCTLCVLAESKAPRLALVALGFATRVFEMAGTCVTWVSTAEILTTDVRGTGHSTANAVARTGAILCPFLVEGDTPLAKIGAVMLIIHIFTVLCVCKLPETKGRGMGIGDDTEKVSESETETIGMIDALEHDSNVRMAAS